MKNLEHATGRPDDVSMGATKPPALEEAAEKEEEENLLGNLWSYDSHAHGALSHGTHCHLFRRSQYLTTISLTNCFAISLVSTFWYVWVMFVSSKFPPTDIERERKQEDLGLLDNTDKTTIITLYWDFFCNKD